MMQPPATGIVKSSSSRAMKKAIIGLFRRDLMAPFFSLPPYGNSLRLPSSSGNVYSQGIGLHEDAAAARTAVLGLSQALSAGLDLSLATSNNKRLRRLMPLLEEEREKEACFHTLLWVRIIEPLLQDVLTISLLFDPVSISVSFVLYTLFHHPIT